jgi:hypothetical protein
MLEKSSMPNMTKKELKVVKSLRLNQGIMILQADEGNCMVVLGESKCNYRLNTLLESWIFNPCPKILQLRLRGRHKNSFLSIKLLFLQI